MKIVTADIQETCKTILSSLTSETINAISELVQIDACNGNFSISSTNKEYYVSVNVPMLTDEELHATVSARKFLSLINKQECDVIELFTRDETLYVNGNGKYKLPIVFADEEMMVLPEIMMDSVNTTTKVSSAFLDSILTHNTKQIGKSNSSHPVQRLYYLDNNGCITFMTGACINRNTIPGDFRILFNPRVAKLFKLFRGGEVQIEVGTSTLAEGLTESVVRFSSDGIVVTALLGCDTSLIDAVPVDRCRHLADDSYANTVTLSTETLKGSLDRLSLLSDEAVSANCEFEFNTGVLNMKMNSNVETLSYTSETDCSDYNCFIDIVSMKDVINSITNSFITMRFGNGRNVVIDYDSISMVIPEVQM